MQKFFFFKTNKEEKCLRSAKKGEKKNCYLPFIFTRKLRNFFCLYETQLWHRKKEVEKKNIASNKTCYKSTLI